MLRSILLVGLFLSMTIFANSQSNCCMATSNAKFASLGKEEGFRNMHETPVAFTLENPMGIMKQIKTEGSAANSYMIKSKKPSDKYLFVIHEWWGLNDHIKEEADILYSKLNKEVNVIALDLYDGKVANDRETASKYMQSVSADRAKEIIQGALDLAGKDAQVASIGWCFGGGWSLEVGLIAGSNNAGNVIYYGMPEMDVDRLKSLEAKVLGIFAEEDQWINHEVVEQFRLAMEAAGKDLQYEVFTGDHAFANPSGERYNENSAQAANKMAVSFLKESLDID